MKSSLKMDVCKLQRNWSTTIQFGKLVRSVSPYTANYWIIYSHRLLTKSVNYVLKQPESKIVIAIDAKGKKKKKNTKFPPNYNLAKGCQTLQKVSKKKNPFVMDYDLNIIILKYSHC